MKILRLKPICCAKCLVEFSPFRPDRIYCSQKCLNKVNRERAYKNNKEAILKANGEYAKNNRAKMNAYNSKYKKKYPAKRTADGAHYRARKLQATPTWLSKEQKSEINEIYRIARAVSTPEHKFEVDHIVPLRGKNVWGLHVPWNLAIMHDRFNAKKLNKLVDLGA